MDYENDDAYYKELEEYGYYLYSVEEPEQERLNREKDDAGGGSDA